MVSVLCGGLNMFINSYKSIVLYGLYGISAVWWSQYVYKLL